MDESGVYFFSTETHYARSFIKRLTTTRSVEVGNPSVVISKPQSVVLLAWKFEAREPFGRPRATFNQYGRAASINVGHGQIPCT